MYTLPGYLAPPLIQVKQPIVDIPPAPDEASGELDLAPVSALAPRCHEVDCRADGSYHSRSVAAASPIYKFKAHKGEALHRQLTKYIRSLILNGELPAGSKLPRMHDLARDWNTNYFTVQTAL